MIKLKQLILEGMTTSTAISIFNKYGVPNADKLSKIELKKAWINLTKKYHPDAGGSDNDMRYINAAYDVLKGYNPRDFEFTADVSKMWGDFEHDFTNYPEAEPYEDEYLDDKGRRLHKFDDENSVLNFEIGDIITMACLIKNKLNNIQEKILNIKLIENNTFDPYYIITTKNFKLFFYPVRYEFKNKTKNYVVKKVYHNKSKETYNVS